MFGRRHATGEQIVDDRRRGHEEGEFGAPCPAELEASDDEKPPADADLSSRRKTVDSSYECEEQKKRRCMKERQGHLPRQPGKVRERRPRILRRRRERPLGTRK